MAEADLALGVLFLRPRHPQRDRLAHPVNGPLGQVQDVRLPADQAPLRARPRPAHHAIRDQREGGGRRVLEWPVCSRDRRTGPAAASTDASARANFDRSGSAPHRAGRKTEAIGAVGGRDERQGARRLRRAEEEAARPLHVRIARPPCGHDAPASRIVFRRFPDHLSRDGLAARKTAYECRRRAAIGPADLTRRHLNRRHDVLIAGTRSREARNQRNAGQCRDEDCISGSAPQDHIDPLCGRLIPTLPDRRATSVGAGGATLRPRLAHSPARPNRIRRTGHFMCYQFRTSSCASTSRNCQLRGRRDDAPH